MPVRCCHGDSTDTKGPDGDRCQVTVKLGTEERSSKCESHLPVGKLIVETAGPFASQSLSRPGHSAKPWVPQNGNPAQKRACMHERMHACAHPCTRLCTMHACTRTRTHVSTYPHARVRVRASTCAHPHADMHARIHASIHACMPTCTHVCSHACLHACPHACPHADGEEVEGRRRSQATRQPR